MKRLLSILTLLIFTSSFTAYFIIKQPTNTSYTLSDVIKSLNSCVNTLENFNSCALPYQEKLTSLTPINKVEKIWVESTVRNNWPNCHELLHQLGHLLPKLTPKELRSSTTGACGYGLLMGYAESKIEVTNENDILNFNATYCDPLLNNQLEYSNQCAHMTGHLSYIFSDESSQKALDICSKIKNHPSDCASGVFMLHYEKLDKSLNATLTAKEALERCTLHASYQSECTPYASRIIEIKTKEDLKNLLEICKIYSDRYNTREACDGVLSINFGKLPTEELISSRALCSNYPSQEKCLRILIYVAALSTNSIETVNKICLPPLSKSKACTNAQKEFDKVFGQ